MMNARIVASCGFAAVLLTQGIEGQVREYRDFALKSDLASVSSLAGVSPGDAKVIHLRPAVMHDLEWRPSRWILDSSKASTDPVEQMVFSFYNDQLFRIVVDYGPDRTEGMTSADMIEAISSVYGAPATRTAPAVRTASRVEIESGSPVARWGDAGVRVVLYRGSSYRQTFRLIVTEPALADLARKAEIQAARLDDQEAPGREVARQKKERDDGQAASEKARAANKSVFRP